MQTRHEAGGRTRAFVGWTLRYGRLLWFIALVLAIPAGWRTFSLYAHLQSALEKLLPVEAPSVIALNELRSRSPGLQHLGVVVDTGDAEHLKEGERFIDDLYARVKEYPPELVRSVRIGDAVEREFIKKHAPLYVDADDLQTILTRIEARKDYEVAKASGALLDDDEEAPAVEFKDIEEKYKGKVAAKQHPNNRFSDAELHATLLLIEVGTFSTGNEAGLALLSRVKQDIAELGGPQAYGPNMSFGFTGDVAINVEETSALISDLSVSSILVFVAVIGVLIAYYRWWRSVFILLTPLGLATLYSFGLASLPPFNVTELNSNTAFLASIILGNGINFGIILLARYVEDRRSGQSVKESLVMGVDAARVGTLAAALAAGASYASLAFTEFRGFAQFGYIGGLGMLMAWTTTFLLMPSLTAWLDRNEATRPKPVNASTTIMPRFAAGIAKAPVLIVLISAVLSVGSLWTMRNLGPDQLESNMSKLRRGDTWVSGEGYWGRKMDKLLGMYLTPMVVMTETPEEAVVIGNALKDAAKSAPALNGLVANVRMAEDVLPTNQDEKVAIAKKIQAALTPRVRSLLNEEQKQSVEQFVSADLKTVTVDDLPKVFTVAMRENSGRIDRAVLVYPIPSSKLWNGPNLIGFVDSVRDVAAKATLPGQPPARVAGGLPLSADLLRSIQHDGVKASVIALLGALAVVIALFRFSRATVLIMGSLLLGVFWMLAGMMATDVKLNFANFIAFPITFGIGVDYAVNVMNRYQHDGEGDITAAIASTGGAVGLCSVTTILGYSSLLLAENRALFLFGGVAVLGEFTCLLTAIVVLPASLLLMQRRKEKAVAPQPAG